MKFLTLRRLNFSLFLIILSIPLFLFLGKKPIQLWDEGRNALNSLDMYWYGFSFITYFENLPDMWNTKPPFLIWLQVLSMEIFGVNEFGIRFPSAFAALLTCLCLFIFLKKYLSNSTLGTIAAFVLVTSNGYVEIHGTRTGDYDSLLTFLLTINSLLLFLFIETKRKLFIYLFFITLALGVLTKSVAGLFFLPAYGLYILIDKKLLFFLKNKHFYFGLTLFIVVVSGFYLTRESLNPGYLKAVYENELGGRFNAVTDGEVEKEKLYYLYNLFNEKKKYLIWSIFLIGGFFIGFLNKNKKVYRLTMYISLILVIHFLILTVSKTKYHWYDTPWYPLMAIITSYTIYQIYESIKTKSFKMTELLPKNTNLKNDKFAIIFLILVLGIPYGIMINKIAFSKSPEYNRNINLLSMYFKDVVNGKKMIEEDIVICTENHQFNALFYIEQLRAQGKKINFVDWQSLKNGQILLMGHDNNLKSLIEENYEYIVLENYQHEWEYWGLKKYKIMNRKTNQQ